MPNFKVSPNIKPAGYLRSLGGYSLDFLFTFLLMVVCYIAIGNTVMPKITNYAESTQQYASLVEQSHLADVVDGVVKDISYDAVGKEGSGYEYGYKAYDERIFHYYFVEVGQTAGRTEFAFLDTDGFETTISDKTSQAYKVEVGKWMYANVYKILGNGEGKGDIYFNLPATDEGYLASPILKAEAQAKLDDASTKQDMATKLLAFYRSATSSDTVYARSTTHFNSQPRVMELTKKMSMTQYLALVPSIVIAPFVFFFLIPIISPNGLTLGKRIVKTAVLGSDGYKAKKVNIVVHYMVILLEFELLLMPNIAIGLMLWMFTTLIDFMVLVMTKNHQSIHDKIARTLVVSAKDSIWFESAEAEESYAAANPSSLVAKTLASAKGDNADQNGRVMVATETQLEAEDQILDLSTINRRREEARRMTSFDAFERGETPSSEETPAENNEEEIEEEIELTEQEKADLEAIYGELPEEELAEAEEEAPKQKEEEEVVNEDDFVDGK